MIKLALFGKMACGKSAIVEALIQIFGGQKVSFADPLKADVLQYGLTEDGKIDKARDRAILQNYGQFRRGELSTVTIDDTYVPATAQRIVKRLERKNKTGFLANFCMTSNSIQILRREQLIGPCHSNYWVDSLMSKISTIFHSNIFIDDIRRENEFSALKKENFTIIKIVADENIRSARLIQRDGSFDKRLFGNISETEIDSLPAPYTVDNNQEGLSVCLKQVLKILDGNYQENQRQECRGT